MIFGNELFCINNQGVTKQCKLIINFISEKYFLTYSLKYSKNKILKKVINS